MHRTHEPDLLGSAGRRDQLRKRSIGPSRLLGRRKRATDRSDLVALSTQQSTLSIEDRCEALVVDPQRSSGRPREELLATRSLPQEEASIVRDEDPGRKSLLRNAAVVGE